MNLMFSVAKQLARRLAPDLFFAAKRLKRSRQFRMGHGGAEYRAKRALVARYGQKVLGGPFRGMRYGDDVACSAYVAKLVGSYEQELHAVIGEAIARRYATVVDIGCAEGYYAVGFAMRLPAARVLAYDTDDEARHYCGALAKLNGVPTRVEVGGLCAHRELEAVCGPSTLVMCDCEGFEHELLNPSRVPKLAVTDILVELHEFMQPGLTREVLSRFDRTHQISLIGTQERYPSEYEVLGVVEAADRLWAVREGRPSAMQWAFMRSASSDRRMPD